MEYRINPVIAVSDSGMVFNPVTGESFTLNPQAFEILNLIRKGLSYRDIRLIIYERYLVDHTELEIDLDAFIRQLIQYQLISEIQAR
jgi:hypothetical protein